jgi:predicted S18 family serine protease
MSKMFRIIFRLLPLLLGLQPIVAQTFNYTISGASVSPSAASYGVGDAITLSWTVNGDPGYDHCYVAIRPQSDVKTDGAIVTGEHNLLPMHSRLVGR